MEPFDRVQTDNEILNRIQDRLKAVIAAIIGKPIIDGQLLDGVTIESGSSSTPVAHKLGRMPRGFIIVSGIPDVVIERASRDDRFLYLQAAGSTVTGVSIWVF